MRLLLAVLLLAACAGEDDCDETVDVCESDADDADYVGDVFIEDVRWSCCDAATNPSCASSWYWYDVFTSGVPVTAGLTIREAGVSDTWEEAHALPSVDQDPDAYWDDRYVELAVADVDDCLDLSGCESRFESGTTTLFPCTDTWTDSKMTWSVSVAADAAGTKTHCVAWGADPDEFPDCEAWTVTP